MTPIFFYLERATCGKSDPAYILEVNELGHTHTQQAALSGQNRTTSLVPNLTVHLKPFISGRVVGWDAEHSVRFRELDILKVQEFKTVACGGNLKLSFVKLVYFLFT